MKKRLLIIITLLLFVVGCDKIEKFYLEDELYNEGKVIPITVDQFKKYEKDNKEFLLFIYLPGCTSCAAFSEVLDDFIVDNKIEIYSISINEMKGTSVMDHIEYAPALFIYKDGKVIDYLDATSDEDKGPLTNVDRLKTWLEEYIYLSK